MLALLLISFSVSAQTLGAVGAPDATAIGTDTAQQKLKEVSVSKFEDAGLWYASMPRDLGIVALRRIESTGSLEKEPIPDEAEIGITENDKYVLGVKVEFYRRAMSYFSIYPIRPLPVEGITKTVSVWVIGRNNKHILKLLISDHFGNRSELTMGSLNFSGWKRLTVAIPTTIIQRDFHYNNKMGIKIEGFRVECDPEETYGSYYIYLDDLRATTDLFAEENRDMDDIQDNW